MFSSREIVKTAIKTHWHVLAIFHESLIFPHKFYSRHYKTSHSNHFIVDMARYDIRKGGGGFGKMEKAKEDEYFYKKTKEDIEKMNQNKEEQLKLVQEHIKKHEGDVRHYEKILQDLQKDVDQLNKKKDS